MQYSGVVIQAVGLTLSILMSLLFFINRNNESHGKLPADGYLHH